MRFLEWLNRCLGKTPPAPNLEFHSLRADSPAGLELVRLEERIVLNVDAGLTGTASDVLQISLDAANDEATVSVVDGGATIQVDDGLGLPGSIMQFDASQMNSIVVTGTDPAQTVNFLGQNPLHVPDSLDMTGFTGDVNIGIQIQVDAASAPDFSITSTVTYLGQYDRVGDQLNVILQNQVGADDSFAVQISGTDLQILDQNNSNALLYSTSLVGLNSIQIQGTDGETDFLSLDYSDTQLTQLSISFEGGLGGNDALEFHGGTFDTLTHQLSGPGAGTIDFSGNAITEINYSGLEPVYGADNTANHIVIELPSATTDAVLENATLPGEMQIRSLSNSFELTTFASPADSLQITTAGSSSIVSLNSYDASFTPTDLILSGQAGDTFQLGGSDLLDDSVSLTLTGGATLDLGTFNETVDQFTLEDGTVIATGGILTAQSELVVKSGTVQAQLNGNNLIKNGSGTVILDALNGFSGSTTVNDGTLRLAQSNAIPSTSSVNLASVTSILDLDGYALSLTSLTGTGSVLLGGPTGSLTLNQAVSTSATFGGGISGDGSLTISGPGEVILSGDSTISGATNVQAGFLTVDGSLGTSEVIVATGATLGGSGSIDAPVTINADAALAPGSSTGILSTGELTLAADADLNLEINGTTAGSGYDQIQVSGEVVLTGATLNISSSFTAAAGDQFVLIDNDDVDGVTGEFVGRSEGTLFTFNGNQVYITYQGGDGNDVVLVVNSPPSVGDQSFSVDENTANTTSVGTITASDPNVPPGSLTFSLTGGSGETAFNVSSTGEITVADVSQLDYESTTSFELEILVTDDAGATDTATITINLDPINDNTPVILNQTRDVNENALNGTLVGAVIAASDADLPNDTLTFTEIGGSGATAFDISSTGQITVADQSLLDYETTTSFTLDVKVSDGVNATDTATITINLNPLNDNAPSISNQTRDIDENAANGTLVGAVIVASDDDLPGDTLTFSESGGTGSAAFDITTGGQIVVADQSLLNFETNPSYTLDVIVNDNAGSTSTATITINLNDLVEDMVVAAGDWSSNDITIIRDGSQIRILETGTSNEIVPSHEFDKVSSIIITGNGSDNTVRLDMSVDTILPPNGISFDGVGGSNTLVGADQTTDWLIDGANSGSLLSGAVSFSNVANLTGNAGADSFVFQDGGQLTGTLSGGNGSDSIDFSAVTSTVTVDLQNSSATDLNQFAGIEQVTGDATLDTISGLSAGTTFFIDGVNQGSVAGIDFDGFSHLAGSSGIDTFQFSGSGQITGSVDGLAGNDILDFSASDFSLDLSLTSTGATDGFAGLDAAALAAFDNINSIEGSSNSDTLTGMNATASWTLNGANQYLSTNTLSFSGFENLSGGTVVDTFNITGAQTLNLAGNSGSDVFAFADGATLDGTLDGQAGADELDYSALTTSLDVVLTATGTFDGFQGTEATISGGFDNINSIAAGAGTADKLTGQNAAATWSIQPSSSYGSGNSLAFSSFETLQGGSDVDQFNINGVHTLDLQGGLGDDVFRFSNNSSSLTGTIDGQGGSDHLDLVNYTADLNVSLSGLGGSDGFDGTESTKSVSFANIDQLTGGSGNNTLNGLNATAIWTLNGTNQYTSTNILSFSGFTNLTGGTDVDTFNITGTQALNLAGNSGSDIFAFADGATLDGTLDGQAGADELDYSALTTSLDVVLTATGSFDGFQGTESTISGGFDNINSIVAGAGTADKLTGQNAAATWSIQPSSTYGSGNSLAFASFETLQGGSDVDQFNINGAHTLDLQGGLGDDVFRFSNNGSSLTGTIDGQGGSDHLDLVNYTADLTVTLSGLGSSDGFDGTESARSVNFANIDQLTGGSGSNTLNGIDSAATWTLNGTNTYVSTNTLTFSSFVNLTGGSDTDIFNVTPNTEAFQIVGGNPTSNPLGDQLNVDTSAAGTAVVSNNGDGSGSITGSFPTVTYSEIENFSITGTVDTVLTGSSNADVIEIHVNGGDIEYYIGGTLIGTSSLTETTTITVLGGDGDDSLTVDASLAAAGVTVDYDGQGQDSSSPGDVLNLLGTTTSVEYYFIDSSSGSIRVDGSPTDFITYSGLEPISSTINATNVTLNYSAVAEIITISDAGGGQTTINSTAGELLTFTNPTGLVTINTGDGVDQIELNSLASNFTASLTINGEGAADTVNINGSLTFDSGKDLGLNVETINIVNDLTLTASSITFGGTVDGASNLEVNTTVTTIFNEAVGSSVALTSLTTSANGTTQINGGSIETTGDQIYNNDVELGTGTTLSSTGTGAITFDQKLNGASTLQVNTAGTTTFNGLVGNSSALTSLTTDAAGDTQINGTSITTTGSQIYHDTVELGDNTILTSTGTEAITFDLSLDGGYTLVVNTSGITTFTGAIGSGTALASLTTDAGGTTRINGGSIKTVNGQIFYDDVELGAATTLTSTDSGTITFDQKLDGGQTLNVNTDGITVFNGAVGNGAALVSLTTDAGGTTQINGTSIDTSGSQIFHDAVELGADTFLTSTGSGAITFDGTLNGGHALEVDTSGDTTFNDTVGNTNELDSLSTDANGTTYINGGSIATSGGQIFNDAVMLGANTFISSSAGSVVQFASTLNGAHTLDVNTAGPTIFDGLVGNSAALTSLTTDAAGSTLINGGTIKTVGAQFYYDDVELISDTTLTSTDSGTITFDQRLNGSFTLQVNTAGSTVFNGTVGDTNQLASLTTDQDGSTSINGTAVSTNGAQIYHDNVELGNDTILTSTSTGAITFDMSLDGAHTLEVNTSGITTFSGAVGNGNALTSLTTDSFGATHIDGGSIKTTAEQIFEDAVLLGDNTVLTSSLSGTIEFKSTLNGAYTLDINTGGTTIFGGLVGNSAALTSLTTDLAGSTQINGSVITTTGSQFYYDTATLGADTTLNSTDSGSITFDQSLDGAQTLNVNTDGITAFNGAVGNGAALVSLTTNAGGTTQINGGSIDTTTDQIFHDAVELGDNTTLSSTVNGALTFDGTLNGSYTLNLETGGTTTFNSTVGNSAALASLTTDTAGSTQINGGVITTVGSQLYYDNVDLGDDTTLNSTDSGTITFDQSLDGAHTLNVNTDGTTAFNGAVGSGATLVSLTTDAGGTTQINGALITTTGSQIYYDNVTLGDDTTLTSTDSGTITFDQKLDGGQTLNVNTDGISVFNGAVGDGVALVSLTTNVGGTTEINGGSIETTDGQVFYDDVELGANTVLTSTSSGALSFDGTLNGTYTLNLNTNGDTTFNDTVGDTDKLVSLTTDANGTTYINGGSIATTGGQLFNDAVELGTNTVLSSTDSGTIQFKSILDGTFTLNVNTQGTTIFDGQVGNSFALVSLTTDAGGTTQINGGSIDTSGAQIFHDDVELGADTFLTSSGTGAITFDGTLNGTYALEVDTSGDVTFNDTVGNSDKLTSLSTYANITYINGGSIATSGGQVFNNAVLLGDDTVISSSSGGVVQFASTLNGAYTLDVNTAGPTIFDGLVGNSAALTSLTTDAAGSTLINAGVITTTGSQFYYDSVTLIDNTTLNSTDSGTITFDQSLDGTYTLNVNTAGLSVFNGAVGDGIALVSLTTNAGGTTQINGGSIETTGDQIFHDAVELGADTILSSTGGGALTFDETLNGNYTLNLNTVGINTFNSTVGNSAALKSLTTNAGGSTQINGGSIITTGDQIFNDDVELGANTALTSNDSGAITFNQRLNGIYTLGVNTAGVTSFNGTVGETNKLTSLTTDADGSTEINGGSIDTTGGQLFNDAVLLGANTVLASSGSGTIEFVSTLNGAHTLNLNTAGTTILGDQVGNSAALISLTTNAGDTTQINGGSIQTTGDQIFNDDVELGANTVLTSTGSGAVTFNQRLNGTYTLEINTSGTTTFTGTVGDTDKLVSLTTNANGTTRINGGSIATSGGQLFNDAVLLGADTVLSSSAAGTIQFVSTLNGTHNLNVNTEGSTIFGNQVGNTDALASLTTDATGTTAVNGGTVTTSGAQTYHDTVTLGVSTVFTSTTSGNITFDETLTGGSGISLQISSTEDVIFKKAVSTDSAVQITADADTSGAGNVAMQDTASLDAGTGTIDIDGANVTLQSLTTTNGSAAAITVDANNGNVITRNSGVNALGDITINATGSITLEDNGVNTGNGGSVNVQAGGDVISTGAGIDTTNGAAAGGVIDVASLSGKVDISNGSLLTGDGGSITVNAVTGFTTLNTSLNATNGTGGGSVEANASNGTVSITGGAVTVNDTGTILLTAKGATSDIQLDTSLTSSAGSITLLADNDITLSTVTSILSQSNGNITLTADNDGSNVGSITMDSGSQVESQGGQIQLTAAGGIALSGITTSGGRVDITSKLGGISDNDSTGVANVEASQLVLNAALGIGQLADAIDTTVSYLEADAGTGGLFLDNTGALTIGGITAQDGLNADLDILIHNTGTLNVTETVKSTTGSITLDSTDTLTIDLATSISTLGTGAILLTSSRNIKLNSGSNLKTVNGGITLLANDGGATTGDFSGVEAENATIATSGTGAILITGYGGSDALTSEHHGVYLHSGTTVSSSASGTDAGTITINGTAGAGIADNHGVFIDGAATTVKSTDGTIDITGSTDAGSGFVLSDKAQIISGGTGADAAAILIHGSTTADQAGTLITSLIQSTDGDISITGDSTGGGAASKGILIQTSAGQVVTTNGPITINGTSNGDDGIEISSEALVSATDSGTIELLGESTGSGSGINLDATLKSKTGTITLTAEDDILLGSSALIGSTSGTVTLTADNAAGSNGDPITMNDGALINAGSGEINLTADGNVLLGGLQTTGTVNVTSLSAAISDNGDSDTDIVASTAVLEAVTGIGDGNPLETKVSTLSATVSGVGNLQIDNGIAVNLLDLSTFGGSITVNNTATMTATSVVSQNDSNSDNNDIALTATGTDSDILVTTITANGLADVILTADDGILDTVGGDSNRITADDLNMSSSSAGGTSDGIDVDTEVNSVTADVNTNSGGIRIDEVDGITLTQLTTLDGSIIVNAGGTIEVLDVTSTNNSFSDIANGITLTATGADSDILVTTLTAQNGADITLNADRDVLDSDSTDSELTSGDLLTIVAGRNIGGITNVFTADGFDPLQTSVGHLDLTSGNQIVIDNTGTTPELINLDAGTGTAGTTYVKATGGALDASTTTGINNTQDTISLISDVSITVPTGLQTSNLRLDAPDIIDAGGGAVDINAVNSILFNSGSAETVNITAQQFDGTAAGSFFTINNDSPALELVDLNSDGLSLTGGTNTNLSLSSLGSITVTNRVQALGSGTLFLETTAAAADLILNHNLLSDTGSVTIETANDILFNGASNLTSTSGTVMLTADADNSAGGAITMADGTYIDAGDGAVSLSASDDITLSQVITTNNTSSAIMIETDSSLMDAGDTNGEDLIANETGARVTIVAALGAGKVGDLNGEIETHVDQIDITNQTSGEIRIIETDDLIIHDLIQSTTGDIEVFTTGDILLNGLIQTASNNVLLDSKAAIIDQNDGIPGELNIQAASLDMNAVTGIGTGNTLEINVVTFSADTTNGDVLLHNTANTGVTATSITTGTGNIEFTQEGNESLAIDVATTQDGSITVSNTGDAQSDTLTLTSISAGGVAPTIDVSTINFGNILLGDVTALDGSISVNSAGEINDAVDDKVSPEVDLNAASGSITLEAVNGIGNAMPVELSAGTLTVNTSTGNIDLQQVSSGDTGPVTVKKLTTGTGTIYYEQTGQQAATFEEISTTDADITLIADGSLLFENPGVLLNVVSTDGSGSIQVTATGVDSSIEINDGFRTVGGTIDLTAQHSLNFGSDGDLNSANGKITLLADSAGAGAGGGGITMSDGTVFDAGTGTVDLQAGDAITVGQLFTTTLTRLTSTDGGIIDAGDTGGRDITAEDLVIRSATGAGSTDALETAVSQLAAVNTDSGSIQIHNSLGGALLTIGTVDGVAGVTNSAGVAGDISITNASPLTVDAPVTNSSGGNIDLESTGPGDLTLNASVRAFGGDGNIDLEAGNGFLAINDTGAASDHSVAGSGVFSGHGDSGVLIDANTTLTSETGAIAGLPPDLRNILTPQILPTGVGTVTGDFGRFSEQNFFITIDWGDGTVETFNFSDPGTFVFQHTYVGNPDPQNPAADIPILVTMQGDKQFTFSDDTGSLDFTSEADLLETPGEGLATVAIDTTPQVPQLLFPQQDVILDASSIQQGVFNLRETQLIETAINEANKNAERLVFMRILAPNGDVIEDVPLEESDLDNLPKLFDTLPDGHYQIYLKEAGEERVRLLMDVDIRNGKASDVTEEQSNPPTTSDQNTPPENNTRLEQSESPTVSFEDLDSLTTVILANARTEEIADRIDLLEQFLINETAEWQTILPQEPQFLDTQASRTLPLPAESAAQLETSDKAWSSAALLSGYFHGRSLFRKPVSQVDSDTALEKYGNRLLNRRYKLNRRSK